MTHSGPDKSLTDLVAQLQGEVAQLRALIDAGPKGAHPHRRVPRRPKIRSLLAVGLLVAFASAGGIGYASVATTTDGSAPSGQYQALTPQRILDTLYNVPAGPVAANTAISWQVAGVGNVPADATAVVLNVTAAQGTKQGSIAVYPDGQPLPLVSNVNYLPGQTVPNLVVATVGTGGKVDFYNRSSGTVQLIADLAGYYSPGSTNTLVVPSDGSATQNGEALAQALTAVNGLGGVADTVIQLEPGTYLAPGELSFPAHTWLVGSGEGITTLQSNAGTSSTGLNFGPESTDNGISNLTLALSNGTNGIFANGGTLEIDNSQIDYGGSDFGLVTSETQLNLNNTSLSATGASATLFAITGGSTVFQGGTDTSVSFATILTAGGVTSIRGADVSDSLSGGFSFHNTLGTLNVASTQIGSGSILVGGTFNCIDDYSDTLAPVSC